MLLEEVSLLGVTGAGSAWVLVGGEEEGGAGTRVSTAPASSMAGGG